VVPLTWWSLGLAVAVSLVIGRLFRLGDDIAEVPISAMLILAVGGSDIAVEGRIVETVIGAVVGVVVGAADAPPLYVRPAGDAVQDVARAAAEVMRRIATEVRSEYSPEQADSWLADARGLGRDILRADRVLATAQTSLRYNPRAISRPDDAVESHGSVVGSEVGRTHSLESPSRSAPPCGPGPEDERLRTALDAAWADRHRLAGLLRQQDRLARDEWQLHGQLTSQIDRLLLRDVDSETRAELRHTWPAPAPVVARLSRRRGR
jgi:hypothetical protein